MGDAHASEAHRLLDLQVPPSEVDIAADFLWRHGAQAVEEWTNSDGEVCLSTDFGEDPLRTYETAVRNDPSMVGFARRWVARVRCVDAAVADTWRQFVGDIVIADVIVRPAWQSLESQPSMGDRLEVLIDPAGAFGMGDHPTTRGTLELARSHVAASSVSRILDLGCGSGILSIALVKDSARYATAVDIARPAVEATLQNAAINKVADRVNVAHGDVHAVEGVFDLVLANILAPVLLADASEIVTRTTRGGSVILSGFTDTRRLDIIGAYEKLGCVLVEEHLVDGWWSLQMQRRHERLELE
jgi:ribosomal protein L11 methyltransferase